MTENKDLEAVGDDSADAEGVLEEAKERWQRAYDADRENLREAWADLRFYNGDQWEPADVQARQNDNRPCLTLNQIPRFVRQVTGDMRMAKPAVRVSPVDDQSDPDTAQAYEGIIRQIENTPDGRGAYFTALDSQVIAGIGHWRVVADYADDDTFDQDLKLIPVRNGLGVLWDPAGELPTREDANYCFVTEEVPIADFKKRYPGKAVQGVESTDSNHTGWFTSETVRIAEYWVKTPKKRTLCKLDDGSVVEKTPETAILYAGRVVKEVERESFKIQRYLISGADILEGPVEWPGRYIPIVRVPGEETFLEGKTVRKSLIRNAKDAQRLYNYWRTAQTEFVALQPKVPFVGTHRNFAENLEDWEVANKTPLPYLAYEPDPSNGGQAPQRAQPPANSSGFDAGVAFAVEDLKATTGLYDASLGERSNETSGRAIMARQREGDVATYVFFDNFSRAVAHTGRILVDLIPHYYDTQRQIRIRGEDGTEKQVTINAPDPADGAIKMDLTTGKYDVVIDSGPSFTTRREEAREGMTALMQAAGPDGMLLMGDLYARIQEWPFADEIAERIKALREKQEAPQGADPMQAVEMQMQAEQAKAELGLQIKQQEAAIDLEKKRAEIAMQIEAKNSERMLTAPMGAGTDPAVVQAVQILAEQVATINAVLSNLMGSQPVEQAVPEGMEPADRVYPLA